MSLVEINDYDGDHDYVGNGDDQDERLEEKIMIVTMMILIWKPVQSVLVASLLALFGSDLDLTKKSSSINMLPSKDSFQ